MIKIYSFVYLFLPLFSVSALSMELHYQTPVRVGAQYAGSPQVKVGTLYGASPQLKIGAADAESARVEVGAAYAAAAHVKAIWAILLTHQAADGPDTGISRGALLNLCKDYLSITSGKSGVYGEEGDARLLAQILEQNILLQTRLVRQNDAKGTWQTKYFINTHDFYRAFDVVFRDGQIGRWDPVESCVPYAIASGYLSQVQSFLARGLKLNQRFSEFKNATMMEIATNFAQHHIVDYLHRKSVSPVPAIAATVPGPVQYQPILPLPTRSGRPNINLIAETSGLVPAFPTAKNRPILPLPSKSGGLNINKTAVPPPPMPHYRPILPLSKLGRPNLNPTSWSTSPSKETSSRVQSTTPALGPMLQNQPITLLAESGGPRLYPKSYLTPPIAEAYGNVPAGANAAQPAGGQEPYIRLATDSIRDRSATKHYVAPKYSGIPWVPSAGPVVSLNAVTGSIPEPNLTFKQLIPNQDHRAKISKDPPPTIKVDGVIHYRVISLRPPESQQAYQRTTIVMAGREIDAAVPEETSTGRVILLVPKSNEAEAPMWLDNNRDVIVIDSLWDQLGEKIPNEELGLVTSRRLAAMYLANIFKLRHFMMLDDNFEHFYVSKAWAQEQGYEQWPAKLTWAEVYELFQTEAKKNQSVILSARLLDYQKLNESLNLAKIRVDKNTQAAKIYFVDLETISARLKADDISPHLQITNKLAWLFPLKLDVWGEDVFFQSALESLKLTVANFSMGSFAYWRQPTGKNSALSKIAPAIYWATPEHPPTDAPFYHHSAFECMMRTYQDHVGRVQHINQGRRETDTAALTAKNDVRREQKRLRENDRIEETVKGREKKKRKKNLPEKSKEIKVTSDLEPPAKNDDSKSRLPAIFADTIANILRTNRGLTASPDGVPFMEHQYKAIIDLQKHLSKNKKRGYVELPTGTGKTKTFLTWLAMAMQEPEIKGSHIAILVPTVDLVDQTYEAIKKFNRDMKPYGLTIPREKTVTKVSSGNVPQSHLPHNEGFRGVNQQVYIFCAQSFGLMVQSDPELLAKFAMIIVDEFHATHEKILAPLSHHAAQNDMLFLGFSATPNERRDFFGEVISYLSIYTAVARGVLCPWENRSLGGWEKTGGDGLPFQLVSAFKHVTHPNGRLLKDTQSLIYVSSEKEAQALAKTLSDNGILAHSFTAETPKEMRERLMRWFAQKKIRVLVAVYMLNMGFDGNVDTVIIGRNVNDATAIQIRGRALRRDPTQPDKIALFVAPDQVFEILDACAVRPLEEEVAPPFGTPIVPTFQPLPVLRPMNYVWKSCNGVEFN